MSRSAYRFDFRKACKSIHPRPVDSFKHATADATMGTVSKLIAAGCNRITIRRIGKFICHPLRRKNSDRFDSIIVANRTRVGRT